MPVVGGKSSICTRKSPPYNANMYAGKRKKGNDGFFYISELSHTNPTLGYRWYKVKKAVKAKKPKRK